MRTNWNTYKTKGETQALLQVLTRLLLFLTAMHIEWQEEAELSKLGTLTEILTWEEFLKREKERSEVVDTETLYVTIVYLPIRRNIPIWSVCVRFREDWQWLTQTTGYQHVRMFQKTLQPLLKGRGTINALKPWPDDVSAPLFALAVVEEMCRTFQRKNVVSTMPIIVNRLLYFLEKSQECIAHEDNIHGPSGQKRQATNLFLLSSADGLETYTLADTKWMCGEINPISRERWWWCLSEKKHLHHMYILVREMSIIDAPIQITNWVKRLEEKPNTKKVRRKCHPPTSEYNLTIRIEGWEKNFARPEIPVASSDKLVQEVYTHLGFLVYRFATGSHLEQAKIYIQLILHTPG